MFWTIVGAILFVFIGLPLIIVLARLAYDLLIGVPREMAEEERQARIERGESEPEKIDYAGIVMGFGVIFLLWAFLK